jgi:hypothetical protein
MTKMFIDGVAKDSDLLVQLGEPPYLQCVSFQADTSSRFPGMGPIQRRLERHMSTNSKKSVSGNICMSSMHQQSEYFSRRYF